MPKNSQISTSTRYVDKKHDKLKDQNQPIIEPRMGYNNIDDQPVTKSPTFEAVSSIDTYVIMAEKGLNNMNTDVLNLVKKIDSQNQYRDKSRKFKSICQNIHT